MYCIWYKDGLFTIFNGIFLVFNSLTGILNGMRSNLELLNYGKHQA